MTIDWEVQRWGGGRRGGGGGLRGLGSLHGLKETHTVHCIRLVEDIICIHTSSICFKCRFLRNQMFALIAASSSGFTYGNESHHGQNPCRSQTLTETQGEKCNFEEIDI